MGFWEKRRVIVTGGSWFFRGFIAEKPKERGAYKNELICKVRWNTQGN